MYAPLIVAALFLAGVIWNALSPQGTQSNTIVGLSIVGLLVWLAWFVHREDRAAARFLSEMLDLATGDGGTGPQPPRREVLGAKVTSYRLTFSCLICSMTFRSRFHKAGSPRRWWSFFWCTLLSLVFGWWSYLGPVHTIRTIGHNLRGGKVQTIQQVIDEFSGQGGES